MSQFETRVRNLNNPKDRFSGDVKTRIHTEKPPLLEINIPDDQPIFRVNLPYFYLVDSVMGLAVPYGRTGSCLHFEGKDCGLLEKHAVPWVVKMAPGGVQDGEPYVLIGASTYEAEKYRDYPMEAIVAKPTESNTNPPFTFERFDFKQNPDGSQERVFDPFRLFPEQQLMIARTVNTRSRGPQPQIVFEVVVHKPQGRGRREPLAVTSIYHNCIDWTYQKSNQL